MEKTITIYQKDYDELVEKIRSAGNHIAAIEKNLKDYFAVHAMNAFLIGETSPRENIARLSYSMAELMLEERKRRLK